MSQEKLISIGQFFMESLQLALFFIYSQGMVMFIVAEENPQTLFLNYGPENISKDI